MKQYLYPFIRDDNRNNLPFFIQKDSVNNDVLVIGDCKRIPLNSKNTSLDYQFAVYNQCQNDHEYSAKEIKPELYIIREKISHDQYIESNITLINHNTMPMISTIEDRCHKCFLSYNSKYIVIWERDYTCPTIDVVAAYDIEMEKMIDCSINKVVNELKELVIKYRRCAYDVIASILTNQILLEDKYRLFEFMTFITNETINEDNYYQQAPLVKEYILSKYPYLSKEPIKTDRNTLRKLNHLYGIDHFIFRKREYNIEGIHYLKKPVYYKKMQTNY